MFLDCYDCQYIISSINICLNSSSIFGTVVHYCESSEPSSCGARGIDSDSDGYKIVSIRGNLAVAPCTVV